MDFGMLPPEINSARMYSGPGVGSMLAASAAWDALAVELHSAAASYESVISALTSGWMGPASASMAAASAPYVAWLHTAATQAEQTGTQAKAAAAAYELAFAMTVPPPVIAANRSLLMALVATNFFGQNNPAIAATEAHYGEMWARDAAAMYGYAGSSSAASKLTSFASVRPTTDQAGMVAQSSAVAHATGTSAAAQSTTLSQALSATPAALQQLAAPAAAPALSPSSLTSLLTTYNLELSAAKIANTVFSTTNAGNSERGILIANQRLDFQLAQDAEKDLNFGGRLVSTAPAGLGGSAAPTATAGLGRATVVGSLSVPPTWVTTAPEIRSIAMALPDSGAGITSAAATQMPLAPGSAFSQSTLGTLSRQGFNGPRVRSRPVIVRPTATG